MDFDPEGDAPDTNGPTPPKLVKFRHLTGIHTPPHYIDCDPPRPGPNIGIYARIIDEEKKASRHYNIMNQIINVAFLGQIIVAASLTALGAADVGPLYITVLGSINTVIAGVQTYLKGQGLPNRIKQYQFGLRKLREHIEDRERDFSHADCPLDVDTVSKDVAAMYQAVRQTAEDNGPDTYLPMGGAGAKLLGAKAVPQAGIDGELRSGEAGQAVPEEPGKAPATDIDAVTAAEDAAAAKAKAKSNPSDKAQESGSKPNHDGETEDSPLLK